MEYVGNIKPLIIKLILQDFKHQQLIGGLKKLELDPELHTLDLISIVAKLMGIEGGNFSAEWSYIYYSYLEQVQRYKITSKGEELQPLAEECYNILLNGIKIEKQVNY